MVFFPSTDIVFFNMFCFGLFKWLYHLLLWFCTLQLLYDSFIEEPGYFQFATAIITNDLEEIQKFLDASVDQRCVPFSWLAGLLGLRFMSMSFCYIVDHDLKNRNISDKWLKFISSWNYHALQKKFRSVVEWLWNESALFLIWNFQLQDGRYVLLAWNKLGKYKGPGSH